MIWTTVRLIRISYVYGKQRINITIVSIYDKRMYKREYVLDWGMHVMMK